MPWTDRLRRWLSRKASATSRAVVLLTVPGEPVSTPRNYERLAKEGYEANVTVYACINEIAKAMGGLRWLEFERRRGRDREVEDSRMRALLARPNPLQGYSRFAQSWTGSLMISGNAYIERVGPGAGAAALMQPPRELWTLRPDRMEVIPDAATGVSAYRYRAGGVEVRLPAPLVHHMTLFAPTNDWYGLSPIQVAATVVDTDNAAQRWNFSLIKNGMRPSGALVVAKNLSEPQFDRLKAQMTEEYAGAERAGLPLLLEGGMTWEEMGINPKDLDWINSRRMSKQDIATLYGTPAELIGLKEATYENRREAKRAFYTETVLPLADAFRDELNAWLVPLFDDSGRRRLEYDRDAIEALQEDREKVWTRVGNAAWLTINEKRVATGYDEVADGDVLLVPFNLLPLGALGEETGPAFGELPAEESEELGVRRQAKDETPLTPHASRLADPARERLWKGFVRQTLSLEREYARAVARWYRQQQDLVLRRLEAYLADVGATRRVAPTGAASKAAEDLLFELDDEAGRLREVSRAYFTRAQQRGGEAVWVDLRAAGAFGADARTAAERLRVQLERGRFAHMAESARRRVARAIDAGLNAPDGAESVAQIASRIRDVYRGLSGPQAQTIARTETARAYNEGRDEAMDQLNVEETEWLSARDEAVREAPYDHTIDGEVRRRGEAFSNGLRYPHDPSGAAGNLINCFLPGMRVAGRFVAGLKARYAGPIRRIKTARGHRLSLTPNHPILTTQGWLPARDLQEGMAVVSRLDDIEGTRLRPVEDEQIPATIEDVFQALAVQRGRLTAGVTLTDLHGDAIWTDGEVDIVGADGDALGNSIASGPEQTGELVVIPASLKQFRIESLRARQLCLQGVALATPGAPGGTALSRDRRTIAFHGEPLQALRIGTPAHLEAVLDEMAVQRASGDPRLIGELLQRFTGLIATDEIIEVGDEEFLGHVFDLQETSGIMLAQNIITSNCRCVALPVVKS